jgi:TPR repeat protein
MGKRSRTRRSLPVAEETARSFATGKHGPGVPDPCLPMPPTSGWARVDGAGHAIGLALFCCLLASFGFTSFARADGIHSTLMDAQKQFEQAHYDQALKLYEQADKAEPGHAAIEYDVGLCHLHLGDADKAAQHFESVASRGEVNNSLRRDAFYNMGLIRARAAREQLKDLLAPATQPSDRKPAPDDPANIPKLQGIADEFLRAIAGFRKSAEVASEVASLEPGEDTEHNIRAARIARRDVLGLLRKAMQAKEKEDILKDPRAYLEALILEQEQQVSLTRLLLLAPPKGEGEQGGSPNAQARAARRAGIRAQRKILENTGTFVDNLSQFRDSAPSAKPGAPASAPSSQPAEETPREKVYHAAAKQLNTAIDSQREACAFLLDNETKPAHEKQSAARDQMYQALYMFPLDPGQALVKARLEQAELRALVAAIKADEDWLRDPLLAEVALPKDARWDADKTPIHHAQMMVGVALALLHRQCEHVATSTQPAEQPAPAQEQKDPALDPELNRKLAEALKNADDLEQKCLAAIAGKDQKITLWQQDELLKLIDAALEILPKTLEQRITELLVRQHRLNTEVQAAAGAPGAASSGSVGTALDEIRKWGTRFKSRLLGAKPATLAETFSNKQKAIRSDTANVNEDVRKEIPAGADAGAAAATPPAASQPAELKGKIEAAKHLTEAGNHMDAGLRGLDQAVVEDSLKPMQPGGPVQAAQAKALEELIKALAALKPPTTQPSEDKQDQKQQKQQRSREKDQDKQRELDRMDKERERAERELYQRRPRTVIKDW